jgi:hypothetical protein
MNNYLQQTNNKEVRYWINHNLKNYLKNNPENVGEIEHIIDYLNSNSAPARLMKMSYDEAKSNAMKWVRMLENRAKNVIETEEDIKVEIDFKDGFKLVQLVGEDAFKREGNLMSHCVASYYGKDNCKILSLRDVNNKPHCTIEVHGNDSINQIKGKGNGEIHPKYIKYVIKILKHLGMEVRESELSNLGYSDLNKYNGLMDLINENFEGMKTITFNNKVFFYNKSKLSRKLPDLPK